MERMILSLKTIYKLLVNSDFPLFSFSVISEKNRKGLTLLKFWQSQMIYEFHSLPCGRMIWRSEGKRNRYISSLCNRTPGMAFYADYARELASQASAKSILKQISAFMDFLQSRSYQHDILIARVEALLPLLEKDDACCSEKISAHLRQLLHGSDALRSSGAEGERFHAACLLSFMMLYAAAGDAMTDPSLACLREIGSMEALWALYCQQKHTDRDSVSFLTTLNEIYGNEPLPIHRYFGREEALFDLREMILAGKKCLISGIGGVGKTELARQIIRHCRDEKLLDAIAIVQYEGSLASSFSRVCTAHRDADDADTLRRMLARLSSPQCGRALVVVDDMNASASEDPDLALLSSLPCAVLITSRQHKLEGFETYSLPAPSAASGMLIFRDNYGRPLTAQDRAVLGRMLAEESLCHTLTLRLMGKAARARSWSIAELHDALSDSGVALSWKEEERTVRLDQMYRQLYSFHGLSEDSRRIVELFSILPHDHFSVDFLTQFFPELFESSAQSVQALEMLAERGWLESDLSGFSMHPLIARCLRRKHLTEAYLSPLLSHVLSHLNELLRHDADDGAFALDQQLHRCCRIVNAVSAHIKGAVSPDWMRTVLLVHLTALRSGDMIAQTKETLSRLMAQCTAIDDELTVLHCAVLGRCHLADAGQIKAIYACQKQCLTVPRPLFLSFCLFCGDSPALTPDFAAARSMLEEALSPDAASWQTITAYYHLATLCEISGDFDSQDRYTALGMQFALDHPQCSEMHRFNAVFARFAFCVKFGQRESAQSCSEILSGMVAEDIAPAQRVMYHQCAATYELQYGSLEASLQQYRQAEAILPECFDAGLALLTIHGQIAIVLQRMKRYDEALALYQDILLRCREPGLSNMLQRFSNNLGVLYLDMGDAQAALDPLRTALDLGRTLGSIALAEALRNMARAYGMLGDLALEKRHLEEGVPLLEQVYGAEHPRAAASRQRLDELLSINS